MAFLYQIICDYSHSERLREWVEWII